MKAMSSYLKQPIDFARHNEEVRQVNEAFAAGKPIRVPMRVAGSITNYFHNPELNVNGYTFDQFFTDPEIQIKAQLAYQYWRRHHLLDDTEKGLPDKWYLGVDFQNSYDASWIGAPMHYQGLLLPDTLPIFDKHKEKLYDMPELIPVDNGLIGEGMAFIDYMEEYCKTHTFMDRPIVPPMAYPGEGTDGVLDLAYKLRGAANLLVDMLEDEAYFADLMEWITNNLIHRMKTLRDMHEKRWGNRPNGLYFADDAICMISHEMYREYVLPYHKRIVDAFSGGKKISMHICGSNMQHFGGLVRELNVGEFDTGFPIDFDRLRDDVGEDVIINGGPTVMCVKDGTPEEIRSEVKRILASGAARSGRFVMIAANNLAPCTPVEHIALMYETVREFGRYPITLA